MRSTEGHRPAHHRLQEALQTVPTPEPEPRGESALPTIAIVLAIVVLLLFVVCGGIFTVFGGVVGAGAVGVNQTTQQAKVEATRLRIQQVEQALQLHAVTHKGRYPTTSEGLETVRDSLSGGTVPTDAWGNQLQYFSPGSHSQEDFEIVSLGRDGQAGGEGPDADI